jgi:methionyl-tRNA formyltransferase
MVVQAFPEQRKNPEFMKILFIGSSGFGLRCLKKISALSEIEICGIISNKETFTISYNKSGVKNVLFADFEEFAGKNKIPFYRMQENMKEEPLSNFFASVKPDFVLTVGWYHLIPASLLSQCPFAGLHASLLPDYSGGAPLVWAIINGEKKTGISFFLMDKNVDSGNIIGQKETEISEEDTIKTLYDRIEILGTELLMEYLPKIAAGTAVYTKQDESKRRIFPNRKPEDGLIDWSWDSTRIKNFIRAQTKPYPGAFTYLNGKKVIIWDADIIPET